MSNRKLFIEAHSLTKSVIRDGDNYQATFSACLKHLQKQKTYKNKRNPFDFFDLSVFCFMAFLFVIGFSAVCFVFMLNFYAGILSCIVVFLPLKLFKENNLKIIDQGYCIFNQRLL